MAFNVLNIGIKAKKIGSSISGTVYPGNTLTSNKAEQWFINGSPVSGQTGTTFLIPYTAVNPGDSIQQTSSNILTVMNYDTDANIDIQAVLTASSDWGTVDTQRINNKWRYNDLILAWKANSVYDTSAFYRVFAGPTSIAGILACGRNGSPVNMNFVSGDYNQLTGLKGNAVNKTIATGLAGTAYPQNDFLAGIYLTETFLGTNMALFGDSNTGTNGSIQLSKGITDTGVARIRANTASNISGATTTWTGLASLGRNNDAASGEAFINGASQIFAQPSTAPLATEMHFFSRTDRNHSNPRATLIWFSTYKSPAGINTPMQTYLANLI